MKVNSNNRNNSNNTNNTFTSVIWTDPDTKQCYNSIVDIDAKLDFSKMSNVVISF